MPNSSDSPSPIVVVIGGGVSGLTLAYRLQSSSATRALGLQLLESRDRLGGAVWTEREDGFTLEGGADSFITNKPAALELCRELGLGDRIIDTQEEYRRSFVLSRGRLVPVPDGWVMIAPSRLLSVVTSPILSLRGKLRLLYDLVRPGRQETEDESLASFARRRFGREALDRLIQPLVGGIYTADPNDLSVLATLPQFAAMERSSGSLIRTAMRNARTGKRSERASGARYGLFVSLADGMDELPRALAAALPEHRIRTSTQVRRIQRQEGSDRWRVELLDGPAIDAHAVVLATEAHVAARLLDNHDETLATRLRGIPYASSSIVHLAYPRDAIAHPLDGFGAVVPIVENRSILAVSFTSVKFPNRAPAGTVLMRVFLGGATQPHLFDREDHELVALARSEMASLIGAQGEPLLARVSRHPRAMPQYLVGHLDRVAAIRARLADHPGLFLTGNAYDGVGLPDCIRAANETAEAVAAYLARSLRTAAA